MDFNKLIPLLQDKDFTLGKNACYVVKVSNPYKRWNLWDNIHSGCEQIYFDMRYLKPYPFAGRADTVDEFTIRLSDLEPLLTLSDDQLKALSLDDILKIDGSKNPQGLYKVETKEIGKQVLDDV